MSQTRSISVVQVGNGGRTDIILKGQEKGRIAKSRVTLKDVAEEAGCSVMSVSNVINKFPSVRADIRERVLSAVEKLNYKPNDSARQRVRSRELAYPAPKTRRFGCLISLQKGGDKDPYLNEMLEALQEELHARNFELSFIRDWNEVADSGTLEDLVGPRNIDVLVLLHTAHALPQVQQWAKSVVVVGMFCDDENLDCIVGDLFDCGWKATEYLLESGHRRIAFVGSSCSGWSKQKKCGSHREAGYIAAMNAYSEETRPWGVATESVTLDAAFEVSLELLSRPDRPTAVFAHNDCMAAGVLKAAAQLGISVPRDLSIIGFNDDHLAVDVRPELTTIHIDKRKIGILIAQTGVERIVNPHLPGRAILLPGKLIVRGSTASLKH